MEPSTLGLAAARSIGKIGSAVISRYKPEGVARVGSPEDRAQAYKRLLDATVHHRLNRSYADVMTETTDPKHPLFIEAVRELMASGAEMSCAMAGVQLCAPAYVIAAAQAAIDTALSDTQKGAEGYKDAQVAFLNAARHDLDYNPKRWQVWKKRKARKFTAAPPVLTRVS
ncbi:hypothetical protein OH797_19365 [Streptomyces anulatus]|uniref:hypothetical protein n=1 Tax=Streptomyces anulatus TaxID=1892 RepID=UPI00386AC66A